MKREVGRIVNEQKAQLDTKKRGEMTTLAVLVKSVNFSKSGNRNTNRECYLKIKKVKGI